MFPTAAAYPGQAILMSRFIDVFQYTGSQMENRGNFFALMFLVLGIGACVVYFVIGWCSNTVATVGAPYEAKYDCELSAK